MINDECYRSKLLREIPDDVFELMMNELIQLRREYPAYRDDELLLYLWSKTLLLIKKLRN